MVTKVPKPINIRVPIKPAFLYSIKNCTSGESTPNWGTESFKKPSPRKRIANPMITDDQCLILPLEKNSNVGPKQIKTRANQPKSTLNPTTSNNKKQEKA